MSGAINLSFPAVVGLSSLFTATASITNGSTQVTLAAAPPAGVSIVGKAIYYGSAFPSGTTVTAISGNTLTVSAASTLTNSAAVIGIQQPLGYTGHNQLAQMLVQAVTTKDFNTQESALVVNFISQTGSGAHDSTNGDFSEKVGFYLPVVMRQGSANCWAENPDLTIHANVGSQSAFVRETDFTNFNGPYTAGGSGFGNACSDFRTYTGFPVTASELWSGSTPNSGNNTIAAATTAGSTSITISNPSAPAAGLSVGDMVTGPGIPNYTYVVSIGGSTTAVNQPGPVNGASSTAILSNAATATTAAGSPATLAIYTYNMFYGINASGGTLVRDSFIVDGTNARTSYTIFGTHYSAFNTTTATLTYAMTMAAGQGIAFNGIDSTFSYGAGGLTYTANGGTPLTIASPAGGVNGISISSATSGYGPQIKAVGPAANIPLNLYAQGSSPIQALSPVTVSGSVTATSFYASGTATLYIGNSRGTAVQIADAGGTIANVLSIQPATTGYGPQVQAVGSDTNIPLNLQPKGVSPVQVLGNLSVTGGGTFGASIVLASYTVATAPAANAGSEAYFTNARKVGEASGAGTGVTAYYSNGAWRRPSDDTQIAA